MNCATEMATDHTYTVPMMTTKVSAEYYTLPIKTNIKKPPATEEADATTYEEVPGPLTTTEKSNTKKRSLTSGDFPAPTNTRNLKGRIWSKVNKKCVCIAVTLIVAVLTISACFAVVFVEVSTLKSQREISAMQLQQPALQEISTLQAQLNAVQQQQLVFQEMSTLQAHAVQQQQHALQEMMSQLNAVQQHPLQEISTLQTQLI